MTTTKNRNPNVDARSAWGVFPHAERRVPTGRGYVVRAMESGYPTDQHNYGGVTPVATFGKRGRKAAEQFADKLTRETPEVNPYRGRSKPPLVRSGGGLEYRTVDTSTLKGLEEAERLKEAGWKIIRSGLFLIQFERRGGRENPKREGFSERSAWEIAKHALEVIAAHASETYPHFESPRGQRDISKARQAIALSDRMLEQLERGIHRNPKGLGTGVTLTRVPGHRIMRKGGRNPPVAILGLAANPPLVTFGDVTRIEYRHRHDGKDYFHDFKRPVQMRRTRAGKVVLSQRNQKPVVKLFEVPGT